MKKVVNLFEQTESDEIKGMDIKTDGGKTLFYVSEDNDVFCYIGVLYNDGREPDINGVPLYLMEKKYEKIRDIIKGFLRIEKGCILLDGFINEGYYKDKRFKKMEYILRLPIGANTYFGVEKRIEKNDNWWFEENKELTSEIFGMSFDSLNTVLESYSKVMHMYSEYSRYPRITRSNKKNNVCDLTGLWITKDFPYITFQSGDFDFSHVSLWGFYRHICMLTCHRRDSKFYKVLEGQGADVESLININDYFGFAEKVTFSNIIKGY